MILDTEQVRDLSAPTEERIPCSEQQRNLVIHNLISVPPKFRLPSEHLRRRFCCVKKKKKKLLRQPDCVALRVWVQPGNFLLCESLVVQWKRPHTPRRRQWCAWVISLLLLTGVRAQEMMQQTSPGTYKAGITSARYQRLHHGRHPLCYDWKKKKTFSHTFFCFKSGLLFFPLPSRHREAGDKVVPQHPSLREHFCGGNRDLRQGLKKNPKAEITAAPNSGANFKPYLLNSLGFQLHFKSKAFVFSFDFERLFLFFVWL